MPSGNVSVDHLCMQVGSMELHKDKKTINDAVSHISFGRDSLTLDEFLDLMYHLLSKGTVARVAARSHAIALLCIAGMPALEPASAFFDLF